MMKNIWLYSKTIEVFENITFRTLIYFGKNVVLGKNYGIREKLWYYRKNFETILKTMELLFTMEKTMLHAL